MKYITIKRYRRSDARGTFNIPYGTTILSHDNLLWYNNQTICSDHSAVMREYFARDDDGLGLERGKLAHDIINTLRMRPNETREEYQDRWEVIYNDKLVCPRYRKTAQDSGDWLWNIEFYNAPMDDLEYIAKLVGVKRGNRHVQDN